MQGECVKRGDVCPPPPTGSPRLRPPPRPPESPRQQWRSGPNRVRDPAPRSRRDLQAREGWRGRGRSGCTCAWALGRTRARGWAPARAPPSRGRLQTQSGSLGASSAGGSELSAAGPRGGRGSSRRAERFSTRRPRRHAGLDPPSPAKLRSTQQVKRSGNFHQWECEFE